MYPTVGWKYVPESLNWLYLALATLYITTIIIKKKSKCGSSVLLHISIIQNKNLTWARESIKYVIIALKNKNVKLHQNECHFTTKVNKKKKKEVNFRDTKFVPIIVRQSHLRKHTKHSIHSVSSNNKYIRKATRYKNKRVPRVEQNLQLKTNIYHSVTTWYAFGDILTCKWLLNSI